jgi:ABC-type transport system involved in multi-copper enzyme maturation permease subunit
MSAGVAAPERSGRSGGRLGFGSLLHAEWTKFRTVRGWVIGLLVAIGVTVLVGLAGPAGTSISCSGPDNQPCQHQGPPTGPDGQPVSDAFYFVHRSLTGNGSITARVTSLTGLYSPRGVSQAGVGTAGMTPGVQPWAKVGVIVKQDTQEGSRYAAVAVTGGHGVRMQYDYTQDMAGLPGSVSASSPRWLRLVRAGDTLTGYDSANGMAWTEIGTATLTGLSSTVQIGLFTASPDYVVIDQSFGGASSAGGPTQATALFDRVALTGTGTGWTGTQLGGSGPAGGSTGGYQQSGGQFTVRGSGDIAPQTDGMGTGRTMQDALVGWFAGLIAVIVVATMFVTGEYRRGLIRTTFAASPRRERVLAAKAIVLGGAGFVVGVVASAIAIPVVGAVETAKGLAVRGADTAEYVQVVVGTGLLVAVVAVLALAVGTLLRRSAGAVTAVILAVVLPYLLAVASVLPAGAAEWLTRLTPAAAFAIQQTVPAYPQVVASYTPANGYFPLPPWAGFAVLCGYTAVALGLAVVALRRRDA